jgi:hypothetical protein
MSISRRRDWAATSLAVASGVKPCQPAEGASLRTEQDCCAVGCSITLYELLGYVASNEDVRTFEDDKSGRMLKEAAITCF